MGSRQIAAVAAALAVAGWAAVAAGQERAGADDGWTPARTADGQPDIQGIWTNYDGTPFETPDDADLERLAPLAYWFPGTNDPDRLRAAAARPREDSQRIGFADGPSAALRNESRRSMVVDPPSGRVPVRPEAEATRDYNLVNLTDSWLNHTPWERCITRGVPGGIFPGGYGAGYQIFQAPGYVVLFYEMIHEARIIPLGTAPTCRARSASGTATRAAAGKATRWSSRRPATTTRGRSARTSPRAPSAASLRLRRCTWWNASRCPVPTRSTTK